MKKFLLFYTLIALPTLCFGQFYSLQIINNSTTGAPQNLFPLDIYINDSLYTSAESLGFQAATHSLRVPLQGTTQLAIATAPSDSAGQAFVVYNLNLFEADKNYVAVLNGGFGDAQQPLRLEIAEGLLEMPSTEEQIQLRAFNGFGNEQVARFELQRSGKAAAIVEAGQFGGFFAVRPGPKVVNLFVEDQASPFRFALDLPSTDKVAYTLLSSGLKNSFPFPSLYAVAPDGQVISGTFLGLPKIVINEIDYDQPGTDDREFIELKNTSNGPISLEGLTLELFNGSVGNVYQEIALPAIELNAGAYFVVCFSEAVRNCDLQVEGSIQNGGTAPDAVLLSQAGVIIDAVVYEGNLVSFTEGSSERVADSDEENKSISRLPDGGDTHQNDLDFSLVCSSPGMANLPIVSCALPNTEDSTLVQVINDYEGPEQLRLLLGDLDLGLLGYQFATAFVKVPAGVVRDFTVLPDTDPVLTSLLEANLVLSADSIYTLVVEGTTAADMELKSNSGARLSAQVPFVADFNFYQGLPVPGKLDVLLKRVGFVSQNLESFEFSTYNSSLPDLYLLEIIDPISKETLATFELDLRTSSGKAQTILLSRSKESQGAIELYLFNPSGKRSPLPLVEFADIQLIQNIPNIEVDIYIDEVLFADNLDYRSATSFQEIRANKNLLLEIKGAESTPADPPILAFANIRFDALSSSLLVLGGDGTASSPVDLFVWNNARKESSGPEQVDLAFFHGGTDVNPLSFLGEQYESIATQLEFGQFHDYQSFLADDLVFAAQESDTDQNLGFFGADFTQESGQAGLVFSSGVINDSQTFGLFVALSDGRVLPLTPRSYSRVQLVNNSPNEIAFDVLSNGVMLAERLAFRQATPYLNVPAGIIQPFQLKWNSSERDSILTLSEHISLRDSFSYQIFISGNVSNAEFPLRLVINDQAEERARTEDEIRISSHQGTYDFGSQNWSTGLGEVLAAELAYGDFSGVAHLSSIPELIQLSDATSKDRLATFEIRSDQLRTGMAVTLFTSGLKDSPFELGLYGVLPDGGILNFTEVASAQWQLVNNRDEVVDLYLDGRQITSGLDYRSGTPFFTLKAEKEYEILLVPEGGNLSHPDGKRFSFLPQAEEVISIFFSGHEMGNTFFTNPNAADQAGGDNKFIFNFFQGSSLEASVDLMIQDFITLYQNVSFGEFTDYTVIEPLSSDPRVVFELVRSADNELLGVYDADFSPFNNQAMTIFTSGADLADFGLWAILPSGVSFPFTRVTDLKAISPVKLKVEVFPNPAISRFSVRLELKEKSDVRISLIDLEGKLLLQKNSQSVAPGTHTDEFSVAPLPFGMYLLEVRTGGKTARIPLVVK